VTIVVVWLPQSLDAICFTDRWSQYLTETCSTFHT
jgi:hypothetical protein